VLNPSYSAFCTIGICLYMTYHTGIGVLGAGIWYEITYSALSCVFGLVASTLVAYSKVFEVQKWFSQKILWVFRNRAAYIRISPDLAKAGSHWVMLLL